MCPVPPAPADRTNRSPRATCDNDDRQACGAPCIASYKRYIVTMHSQPFRIAPASMANAERECRRIRSRSSMVVVSPTACGSPGCAVRWHRRPCCTHPRLSCPHVLWSRHRSCSRHLPPLLPLPSAPPSRSPTRSGSTTSVCPSVGSTISSREPRAATRTPATSTTPIAVAGLTSPPPQRQHPISLRCTWKLRASPTPAASSKAASMSRAAVPVCSRVGTNRTSCFRPPRSPSPAHRRCHSICCCSATGPVMGGRRPSPSFPAAPRTSSPSRFAVTIP